MSIVSTLSATAACSLLALAPATATQERLNATGEPAEAAGDARGASEVAAADDGDPGKATENVIPGEILVKFEAGLSQDEIDRINRRLGATVVNTMMDGRLMLVTVPYENTTSQLVNAYSATDGVEYAEPNQRVSLYPPPSGEPPAEGQSRGGGLPPPNEDGSAPLVPLPGPN